MGEVSRHELESFISYAIIALVVLPFCRISGIRCRIPLLSSLLASYDMTLDGLPPSRLLTEKNLVIVVLVTGIDVFGYLLENLSGMNAVRQ